MTQIDMALEILPATHDGDDLAPQDLYLVQCAVNDHLSDAGKEYFAEMHRKVVAGEYRQPWLAGVEHLTIDHEGFVCWKGRHVEHYTTSAMTPKELKSGAEELAQRCRIIEEYAGLEQVSSHTAIWLWPEEGGEAAEIAFARRRKLLVA